MLGLLDGLKRTSSGIVIYDQIARLVEEQEGVQSRVDHTYAALLHLLLDAYARDPSADHITRLNARLIQLRRGFAPASGAAVSPDKLDERIRQAAAGVTARWPTRNGKVPAAIHCAPKAAAPPEG
jgi:hypothetical protein